MPKNRNRVTCLNLNYNIEFYFTLFILISLQGYKNRMKILFHVVALFYFFNIELFMFEPGLSLLSNLN
jgi:hypothetical protein